MKYDRGYTISWLENNQINGAFDGFPESDFDFESLTDEELKWYFDEWIEIDCKLTVNTTPTRKDDKK